MTAAHLALIAVLVGLAPDADPTALVARLGSPRFAEREAAAAALEQLGREALPALRGGLGAKDPEVRTRAAALATKIERELIVRPTMVTLDFRGRPRAEVVRAIADRSGIPVVVVPDDAALGPGRRITLEEPQPVPFWTAIDRLCQAGQLSYSPLLNVGANTHRLVLQAAPGGGPTGLMVDSGPFRVALLRADHHRSLDYIHPPPSGVAGPAPARPAVSEQFSLSMQVVAEPRLTISQSGPLKLLEAVDDRGQSLRPLEPPGASIQRSSGYAGYSYRSNPSSFPVQVQLKLPDQPGRIIKTLRGGIPLAVSAPKPNPLVITLAGAAGRTVRAGDTALTIDEIKDDPLRQQTTIGLTLHSPDLPEAAVPGAPEIFGDRASELAQNRIEILDARGTVIQAMATSRQATGGQIRLTLMLPRSEGAGAPTRLRYFDLARATAEASFEFTNIPMP